MRRCRPRSIVRLGLLRVAAMMLIAKRVSWRSYEGEKMNIRGPSFVGTVLLALVPAAAWCSPPSQVLTAVCRSPAGTTLVTGERAAAVPDSFGDGLFTYTWRVGEPSGTIVSQSGKAAGGVPATESAFVLASDGFVTFLVKYERAMWMHTLFFDSKTIIISRHVNSSVRGTAVGGLYKASCSVAVQ